MPLHSPAALVQRLTRLAAVAAAAICATAGAVTIADASQPVAEATRYFDIEANKAASMRALGIATMQAPSSPYHDLEANKARSRRAR